MGRVCMSCSESGCLSAACFFTCLLVYACIDFALNMTLYSEPAYSGGAVGTLTALLVLLGLVTFCFIAGAVNNKCRNKYASAEETYVCFLQCSCAGMFVTAEFWKKAWEQIKLRHDVIGIFYAPRKGGDYFNRTRRIYFLVLSVCSAVVVGVLTASDDSVGDVVYSEQAQRRSNGQQGKLLMMGFVLVCVKVFAKGVLVTLIPKRAFGRRWMKLRRGIGMFLLAVFSVLVLVLLISSMTDRAREELGEDGRERVAANIVILVFVDLLIVDPLQIAVTYHFVRQNRELQVWRSKEEQAEESDGEAGAVDNGVDVGEVELEPVATFEQNEGAV